MVVVHPEIVLLGDPVLRERARRIKEITPGIRKAADEMIRIMHEARGVGLAAPQIGLPLRLFVARHEEQDHVFINPRLIDDRGREVGEEGCLSLPGLYGEVPRATRVRVVAQNRLGREIQTDASGFLARVLQHELDHLNGVLFIDHARRRSLHLVLEQAGEEDGEPERTRVPLRPREVEPFFRLLAESGSVDLPEIWHRFRGVRV